MEILEWSRTGPRADRPPSERARPRESGPVSSAGVSDSDCGRSEQSGQPASGEVRTTRSTPPLGTVEDDAIHAGVATRCLAGRYFCPTHEVIAAKLGELFSNRCLKEGFVVYMLSDRCL